MELGIFTSGLLGSLAAGSCTAIGALPILLRAQWSDRQRVVMLAVAAGVMLGATIFSLLLPALAIVQQRGGSELDSVLVASAGLLLGAVAIWALHAVTPHEHFSKGREGPPWLQLGRYWLLVIAITLHNFPEGMSVGVAFGPGPAEGLAVAIGIGLQNLPEGLAVAAALAADGATRTRAFLTALATGLVEPVGGAVGAAAVSLSSSVLPWALAFSAGAMLFVISGEIIPETHHEGFERPATFSLVVGFIVMMMLDVLLA
jgi:zinc transporter, ZIP family